jgi:hypothetical protein
MLVDLYVEALLIDEGLADEVWELWNAGLISDDLAAMAWWIIALEQTQNEIQIDVRLMPLGVAESHRDRESDARRTGAKRTKGPLRERPE